MNTIRTKLVLITIAIAICVTTMFFVIRSKETLCNIRDFSIKSNQDGMEVRVRATLGSSTAWYFSRATLTINKENNFELRIYSKKRSGFIFPIMEGQIVRIEKLILNTSTKPEKGQKLILILPDTSTTLATLEGVNPDKNFTYQFSGHGYYYYLRARKEVGEKPNDKHFYEEYWVKGNSWVE